MTDAVAIIETAKTVLERKSLTDGRMCLSTVQVCNAVHVVSQQFGAKKESETGQGVLHQSKDFGFNSSFLDVQIEPVLIPENNFPVFVADIVGVVRQVGLMMSNVIFVQVIFSIVHIGLCQALLVGDKKTQ